MLICMSIVHMSISIGHLTLVIVPVIFKIYLSIRLHLLQAEGVQ